MKKMYTWYIARHFRATNLYERTRTRANPESHEKGKSTEKTDDDDAASTRRGCCSSCRRRGG